MRERICSGGDILVVVAWIGELCVEGKDSFVQLCAYLFSALCYGVLESLCDPLPARYCQPCRKRIQAERARDAEPVAIHRR